MRNVLFARTVIFVAVLSLTLARAEFVRPAAAEPAVWSGYTFDFVKPDFEEPFAEDSITPNVSLTRGFSQGLYNAVAESAWNGNGPTGTLWATSFNNPGETIAATNTALHFGSFLEAYGGSMMLGNVIVGTDAVVRLTADDINLDLRFTQWTTGGRGGGFAYLRGEAPLIPEPTSLSLLLIGASFCIHFSRRARGGVQAR